MRTIEVYDRPMNLSSGTVELNADQARRRRHAVRAVEGRENIYTVVKPIQFKVGEKFGLEGDEPAAPGKNAPKASGAEAEKGEAAGEKKAQPKEQAKQAAGKGPVEKAGA